MVAPDKTGSPVTISSYDQLIDNGDSTLIESLGIPKSLTFKEVPRIISNNHKPGWSSFPGNTHFNQRHKALDEKDSQFINLFLEKQPELKNIWDVQRKNRSNSKK